MTHRRLPQDAFVFDLDGTLVDSVYQHVMAWREALGAEGIELSTWRIHRKVGMSGGLMSRMLLLETGVELDPARADRLRRLHADAYRARLTDVRPLPGAQRLLSSLTEAGIPWAIATSGGRDVATSTLRKLGLDLTRVPVVTRDEVEHAKPDPDLFLAAAERLGVASNQVTVVGVSVWDMLAAQRARTLGVGLLSGGYGEDELVRAGAYRVYEDPAGLLDHLDEVAARQPRPAEPT